MLIELISFAFLEGMNRINERSMECWTCDIRTSSDNIATRSLRCEEGDRSRAFGTLVGRPRGNVIDGAVCLGPVEGPSR